MLNLNKSLGCWILAMGKESMRRAWKLIKETGITLKDGLKQAWKEIKEEIESISKTYKEHKATLSIKQNNKINNYQIKGENMEELMENILEKIAEIKGKVFYNNFFSWFSKKWDSAIQHLEDKKKYTFSENQIWAVM